MTVTLPPELEKGAEFERHKLCAPCLEGTHLQATHGFCYDHAISYGARHTGWTRTRVREEPALYGNKIIHG